jgi:hypothetical protein
MNTRHAKAFFWLFHVGCFAFMPKYLDDLLFLIGAVLAVIGIAQIYPPAAWISAGAFCISGAVLVARANVPARGVTHDPDARD